MVSNSCCWTHWQKDNEKLKVINHQLKAECAGQRVLGSVRRAPSLQRAQAVVGPRTHLVREALEETELLASKGPVPMVRALTELEGAVEAILNPQILVNYPHPA